MPHVAQRRDELGVAFRHPQQRSHRIAERRRLEQLRTSSSSVDPCASAAAARRRRVECFARRRTPPDRAARDRWCCALFRSPAQQRLRRQTRPHAPPPTQTGDARVRRFQHAEPHTVAESLFHQSCRRDKSAHGRKESPGKSKSAALSFSMASGSSEDIPPFPTLAARAAISPAAFRASKPLPKFA